MLFPKHQSQFSRDAVYFVVIEKHNEHSPSIGFFHHRKHETGFLAYAVFSTEIQTVKLERSKPSFVSDRPASLDASIHRIDKGFRCLPLRETRRLPLFCGIPRYLLPYPDWINGH